MSNATMRAAALSPFFGSGPAAAAGAPARPARRPGWGSGAATAGGPRGAHQRAPPCRPAARRGPAQALGARTQVEDELRHVALHLLDALAQAVGRRGDPGHVLAGLGAGRVVDLLRAALGRLDDRLDLIAGLRRERRGDGGLPAQLVELVGDPVEVRVDRRRIVTSAVAGEVVAHDGLAIEGHGGLSLARSRRRPAGSGRRARALQRGAKRSGAMPRGTFACRQRGHHAAAHPPVESSKRSARAPAGRRLGAVAARAQRQAPRAARAPCRPSRPAPSSPG
jgi:hypothetical protein